MLDLLHSPALLRLSTTVFLHDSSAVALLFAVISQCNCSSKRIGDCVFHFHCREFDLSTLQARSPFISIYEIAFCARGRLWADWLGKRLLVRSC